MKAKNQNTIAAFDFDGTLTRHDTLIPFFTYLFGKPTTYLKLAKLLPYLAAYPLGGLSRKSAKELILTSFLDGYPLSEIQEKASLFAQGPLFRKIKGKAWERFQWHRAQGHTCVLISANLSLYLTPFGQTAGFDHIIASQMALGPNDQLTGKLLGENCWGKEKVRRLTELFGPKNYQLYAYGDSQGDLELLALADYPFYRKI